MKKAKKISVEGGKELRARVGDRLMGITKKQCKKSNDPISGEEGKRKWRGEEIIVGVVEFKLTLGSKLRGSERNNAGRVMKL